MRCLLSEPLFAKQGQMLTGKVLMVANAKQSYDLTLEYVFISARQAVQ